MTARRTSLSYSRQSGRTAGFDVRAGRVALLLALITAALSIACGGGDGDGANVNTSPSAGSPANGDSDGLVELQMTAGNTRFDKSRLFAPAGSEVSLTLDNKDSVEHSFSLYPSEGSTDPLFEGSLFSGPAFLVYQFTAPEDPGTYHFQCDVHPDVMKGEFVVESTVVSPT
jgi:plastocyanin